MKNKDFWENAEVSQGWLKDLMDSDPETIERRKKVKPMSEEMQDLFAEMDNPSRKSPKN